VNVMLPPAVPVPVYMLRRRQQRSSTDTDIEDDDDDADDDDDEQQQQRQLLGGDDDGSGRRISITFVQDGHEVRVDGATLRLVHTPGHTADHAAIWLKEETAVFSGDCVLGQGTSIFEDLHAYMASLRKLLQLAPVRIYPGHGPVVEPADACAAKIADYISHRERREREIVDLLLSSSASGDSAGAGAGGGGLTQRAITNTIYADVPFLNRLAASGAVKHHLDKLVKDDVVTPPADRRGVYRVIKQPNPELPEQTEQK